MRLILVPVVYILTFAHASAQKLSILGILRDSAGNVMPSGTVVLLNPTDSSLLNFTPSDAKGFFNFQSVPRRSYLLKVSYIGFETFHKLIEPEQWKENEINLGEIVISEASKTLDEVTITGEEPPGVIKKDTIEFNASSFKTKANDVVEDLLKKLPGVEVDNDGTIRAQGQEIQRITVDGKTFFGNDPRLATRNLPADAIAKIQVFDKKSDQAAFTGIDDGQREKTINIQLKEERWKGMFGNVSGGVGTESRASGKLNLNRFRKQNQISVLGQANNVNERGFGIDDYMNFTGGSQVMGGRRGGRVQINAGGQNSVPLNFGNRQSGLMTTYAGGANFNQTFKNKTEVGASYFYNHLNHRQEEDTRRQSFFENGLLNYNEQRLQNNRNYNHRANVTIDQKIDSMNSIKFTGDFNKNTTESLGVTHSSNSNKDGVMLNSSVNRSQSHGTNDRLNSTLLWRHRFNKKGRSFTTNLNFSLTKNDRLGRLNASIEDAFDNNSTLYQRNTQQTTNSIAAVTTTYTEPLGNRMYLEVNYSFRENRNDFQRNVFDLEEQGESVNPTLSSSYGSVFKSNRGGINFRLNRKDFNFSTGVAIQDARLLGEFETMAASVNKSFTNILSSMRLNRSFGGNRNLELAYETQVREPSVLELQPVVDNTDPLNLYVGNPQLRPSYLQNIRLNYGAFNPVSFMNFFMFVEASFTNNAITTAQSLDGDGVRLSMPVNVNDVRTVRLNSSFSFPIKKLSSRIGLSSNVSSQSGQSVINDYFYNTTQTSLRVRARYDFQYKEWLIVGLSANLVRQGVHADFELQRRQLQFNYTYASDLNVSFLKHYSLSAAFEYLQYINKTTDFDQAVPFLNMSLSRFLFKSRSGELKLSVVNLLDEGAGVIQNTGVNYIEQSVTNTLGRYLMVSFVYSLNRQLNSLGARPSGRVMRIIN